MIIWRREGNKVAIFFKDQDYYLSGTSGPGEPLCKRPEGIGCGKEDRVMLRSANIPEFLIWNFACWRIGAIPVMVNHMDRSDQVEFKANDSEAVAMCVHSDWSEDVIKFARIVRS